MWKFTWFLRDFGYDTELLGKDEIDDQALVGLQGVLKVSHAIVHGISVLNLDGFAPLSRWKELSPIAANDPPGSEVLNGVQLHPDKPVLDLPAPLPSSLFGWLAGKRYPGSHALRA